MIKKSILLVVMFFSSLFTLNYVSADWLDDAISDSQDYQITTEKPNDAKVEGWVKKSSKVMLKITIMVGVAVFLYGGINFLLSMGDDSKAKKTRDTLITSGLGLIIAFGAWAILQLIMSVGTTIRM